MARTKKGSKKKTSTAKGKRSRGKKNKVSLDFEGVESGGRSLPDGNYQVAINKIETEEGESGYDYWSTRFKVISGKYKGTALFDNLSHSPAALFKIKSLLEAGGYEVPDGVMDLDPDDLIDMELEVEVQNEEWEGKDRPRITSYLPAGEEEEEEEEEDPDEEEEEEIDGEEEEGEEDEDEEEEEDEPPKKKRSRSKAKGKGKGKKLRVGSKVKFKDEEGDWVKAVITDLDDDVATVEDASGDEWEVDLTELKAA